MKKAGFGKSATVTAKVVEARSRTFSILGASNQPGQYAIPRSDFHLRDALSMSNGLSAEAGEMLYVLRDDAAVKREDKKRLIKIARTALESGDASQNIVIRTDDLILVRPRESTNSNPLHSCDIPTRDHTDSSRRRHTQPAGVRSEGIGNPEAPG